MHSEYVAISNNAGVNGWGVCEISKGEGGEIHHVHGAEIDTEGGRPKMREPDRSVIDGPQG
jgi:hypothetical protein